MKNKIDATAAEWVAREDAGPLSSEQSAALAAWLAADSRHLGAYGRMHAIMMRTDRIYRGASVDADENQRAEGARGRAWGMRLLAMAASLTLVAGVAWFAMERQAGVHATRVGEVAHVSLEDGSEITLNTDSRVRVRYEQGRRGIELLRGEAMFDVAKDPQRPFVVNAGGTQVIAVGTSFTVKRSSAQVDVLVREGIVQVQEQKQELRLLRGDKVRLATRAAPVLRRVDDAEVRRELAWRNGMIAFSGQTLQEVTQEFARYNRLRIRLADPGIADLEVVGMFSATDPIGFSRAAAQSMQLDMALGDDEIVLRARATKKNQ
ncbi:FecR family protein [Stenotrophomonas humi]|uniref:FecR family protein n=1 Tax=Stenotrophomonas humi TaxID=405444 RepID=UPI000710BC69|nr:FecR domain-containing protein [Stenotrophomonas humi]